MPAYEAMFIFRPGLKEEEQKALITGLEGVLKKSQAEIKSMQLFGKRHLAYEIKKHKEGLYYIMNFSATDGSVVASLKHSCNIDENVLRVLVVRKGIKR